MTNIFDFNKKNDYKHLLKYAIYYNNNSSWREYELVISGSYRVA